MRSPEEIVLAACLPKDDKAGGTTSHLSYVLDHRIDDSYFQGHQRWLWKAAIDASLFSTPLDVEMLSALLEEWNVPEQDKQLALISFLDLSTLDVPVDKVKVILPSFREGVHKERLAEVLQDAAKILTEGLPNKDKGIDQGYKDTKSFVLQKLTELESHEIGTLPSQEIRAAASEVLAEYNRAKTTETYGVLTGFKKIDELTRGIQKGELWIFCGYTGEGKSQLLINMAYNACVNAKANVVFVSLEMPLVQVRRRIYVRHSNHPLFSIPGGILYKRVKEGSLNVDEEKLFFECVEDFGNNADYGKMHVLQIGKSETVLSLREKLSYLRSKGPIDLLALDYASLMGAHRRRSGRQDEIVEVIESLKALALTFNEGEGLAILTANQISRQAKEEANRAGRYGISFASETSAIEKNADLLGWILRNEELVENHEAKIGVAKYRDGDVLSEFTVMEQFASGLLADLEEGAHF